MDASKKRKLVEGAEEHLEEEEEVEEEEDDEVEDNEEERGASAVSEDEIRALIEPLTEKEVVDVLVRSALDYPKVVSRIRARADQHIALRKLCVRGLGKEMSAETLKGFFSQYGDIEGCSIVKNRQKGKSKGFGFVTFKNKDAAQKALADPNKKIDGRTIIVQLASNGASAPWYLYRRNVYVGNVTGDLSAEKLLSVFSKYGEIEEGPIGFDKETGKSRGYAIFVYKSPDSAKRAVKERIKKVDGHKLYCKMSTSEGRHIATSEGRRMAQAHASDSGKAQSDSGKAQPDSGNPQSGGTVGAAPPNIPFSALSGLFPWNQSMLGQHALLAAQAMFRGLSPNAFAHQLALGSSLRISLDPSLNTSRAPSLHASLPQGGSHGLSQSSLASSGLQGLGAYGSQIAGLGGSRGNSLYGSGGSSLYGGPTSSIGSQTGLLHGIGQGYTSSERGLHGPGQGYTYFEPGLHGPGQGYTSFEGGLHGSRQEYTSSERGQGAGGRSQYFSGYFGT